MNNSVTQELLVTDRVPVCEGSLDDYKYFSQFWIVLQPTDEEYKTLLTTSEPVRIFAHKQKDAYLLCQALEGKGPTLDISEHQPCGMPPSPLDKRHTKYQWTVLMLRGTTEKVPVALGYTCDIAEGCYPFSWASQIRNVQLRRLNKELIGLGSGFISIPLKTYTFPAESGGEGFIAEIPNLNLMHSGDTELEATEGVSIMLQGWLTNYLEELGFTLDLGFGPASLDKEVMADLGIPAGDLAQIGEALGEDEVPPEEGGHA